MHRRKDVGMVLWTTKAQTVRNNCLKKLAALCLVFWQCVNMHRKICTFSQQMFERKQKSNNKDVLHVLYWCLITSDTLTQETQPGLKDLDLCPSSTVRFSDLFIQIHLKAPLWTLRLPSLQLLWCQGGCRSCIRSGQQSFYIPHLRAHSELSSPFFSIPRQARGTWAACAHWPLPCGPPRRLSAPIRGPA